jgi:hypothetical protein
VCADFIINVTMLLLMVCPMSETAHAETDADLIKELNDALNVMLDRNEALQAQYKALEAELALAKSQLKAMFDGNVGSGVLQEIALDPTQEPSLRAKCAAQLLQTEKPRLSAVMTTNVAPKLTDIFKRVEAQGEGD